MTMPARLLITLAFPPDIGGMQSFAYQRCLRAGDEPVPVRLPEQPVLLLLQHVHLDLGIGQLLLQVLVLSIDRQGVRRLPADIVYLRLQLGIVLLQLLDASIRSFVFAANGIQLGAHAGALLRGAAQLPRQRFELFTRGRLAHQVTRQDPALGTTTGPDPAVAGLRVLLDDLELGAAGNHQFIHFTN